MLSILMEFNTEQMTYHVRLPNHDSEVPNPSAQGRPLLYKLSFLQATSELPHLIY